MASTFQNAAKNIENRPERFASDGIRQITVMGLRRIAGPMRSSRPCHALVSLDLSPSTCPLHVSVQQIAAVFYKDPVAPPSMSMIDP
jgi:hypothetical protein